VDAEWIHQAITSGAVGVTLCFVLMICKLLSPYWVVKEKNEVIAELKATVQRERERGDTAVQAAQAARDTAAALQAGVYAASQQSILRPGSQPSIPAGEHNP
jgi:hypothetical protein